jgi:group I intron endonuclease
MRVWTVGIYAIRNKITGKYYVGSAVECEKRWSVHLCHLRRGTHHSVKLQRAWNKYGSQAFRFRILEQCKKDELARREQYWMDHYDAYRRGYNCMPFARTNFGYKVTPKTLENIRAGAIRRAMRPEERKLRSERAKAQHAAKNFGAHTWNTGPYGGAE